VILLKMKIENDKLTLVIDLNRTAKLSKGGKMMLIESTRGFIQCGETSDGKAVKLGMNCGYDVE